jgi:hypothetical protein
MFGLGELVNVGLRLGPDPSGLTSSTSNRPHAAAFNSSAASAASAAHNPRTHSIKLHLKASNLTIG